MPSASQRREASALRQGNRRPIYYNKLLANDQYLHTAQYQGEWKNDKRHGRGTLQKANGTRYVGEWAHGNRHGQGTLWTTKDGKLVKRYQGQWVNDCPHGSGIHYYKNGDIYNGEWCKGVRHGSGALICSQGESYDGKWFNDYRHGFGVQDLQNGDHFEGFWAQGKREGTGVHFYYDAMKKAHTRRYDGEWVDGVAKCGFYTELPADPLAPASRTPDPLPELQLADPDGVISARRAEIAEQRKIERRRKVPIDEHFVPEEIDALRAAFHLVCEKDKDSMPIDSLDSALQTLGLDLVSGEQDAVLAHLGKGPLDGNSLSFIEFVEAVDFVSPFDEMTDE